MNYFRLILCVVFALGQLVSQAAEFKNLGFDEPDTTGLHPNGSNRPMGIGDPLKVLPGWELLYGNRGSLIYVNEYLLASQEYAHLGDRQSMGEFPELGPTGFGFAFRIGRDTPQSPAWTLQQTGTIPADAKYFTYRNFISAMEVWIDGRKIPPLNPPVDSWKKDTEGCGAGRGA